MIYKNYRLKFNVYEKSLMLGFLISVLCSIVNFSAKCNVISDKVLRLHVIANSDSAEDQNLKLKVRDSIIKFFENQNFKSREETKKFASDNLDKIRIISQNEILKNGFKYNVEAKVCKASFNTRVYDEIALPAGEYDSLKIIIGDGKGKNWWCVIFPPMCIPAAEKCNVDRKSYNENFSKEDKNVIENKDSYKIKFKVVELFESAREACSKFTRKCILLSKKIVYNSFDIRNFQLRKRGK